MYLAMTTLTGEVFDYIGDAQDETRHAEYRMDPGKWYDDVVGLGGVMFRQALSLATVPNNLEAEPIEPSRRHPRSWVTLVVDKLVTS
jgi:hypothetical protein